tara:strand:+ start:52 stop:627 length:576 start_codon:yes stop_codon:yes gene_type:complete
MQSSQKTSRQKEFEYAMLATSLGVRGRGGNPYSSNSIPSNKEHADNFGVSRTTTQRWEGVRKQIMSNPELSIIANTLEGYSLAKRKLSNPAVYVYRMESAITGELLEPTICKIGATLICPNSRVNQQVVVASAGYVARIELVHTCDDPFELESYLHDYFKDNWVDAGGKEWFKVTTEQIKLAIEAKEKPHG